MRRTYERRTNARLSFSGVPHAPVNMAHSMGSKSLWWEVNVGGINAGSDTILRYILYAKFSQILKVLLDFHRLFGSRNSPTNHIRHTIRYVYRSVWSTGEAKPRFERPARACLWSSLILTYNQLMRKVWQLIRIHRVINMWQESVRRKKTDFINFLACSN